MIAFNYIIHFFWLQLCSLNNVYLFLFKSKVVNLGILAQKSDFCLKLEEGLVNNKCKLNYKIFYQVSPADFTSYEEKFNEILAYFLVAERR